MTAEYFYTLDLGAVYGEKLETLAAFASYDDVEAFAAMLLRSAIDRLDQDMKAELARADKEATAPESEDPLPF